MKHIPNQLLGRSGGRALHGARGLKLFVAAQLLGARQVAPFTGRVD